MIRLGMECCEWNIAGQATDEMIAEAVDSASLARADYQLAVVLMDEGEQHHKTKLFTQAHEKAASAIAA